MLIKTSDESHEHTREQIEKAAEIVAWVEKYRIDGRHSEKRNPEVLQKWNEGG